MSDLREQLLKIREESGRLTPQTVVDAARPTDHPLHPRFEWDNRVAGEAWRREQAHRMIQSVRVVYEKNDRKRDTRAFQCADRSAPEPVYDPVEEIAQDPVARAVLLQQMERDWQALKARYDGVAEFIEMVRGDLAA